MYCGKLASEVIRLLLSRGADPWLQDDRGTTVLHYACMRPTFEVIKPLLAAGASVAIPIPNNAEETPLHILAKEELKSPEQKDDLEEMLNLFLQGHDESSRAGLLSAEAYVDTSALILFGRNAKRRKPLDQAKVDEWERMSENMKSVRRLNQSVDSRVRLGTTSRCSMVTASGFRLNSH
jgi:ankyrin repeat protein